MHRLTPERIARAQELDALATPGPWDGAESVEKAAAWWGTIPENAPECVVLGSDPEYKDSSETRYGVCCTNDDGLATEREVHDAEFICFARSFVPDALADIENLKAENRALRKAMTRDEMAGASAYAALDRLARRCGFTDVMSWPPSVQIDRHLTDIEKQNEMLTDALEASEDLTVKLTARLAGLYEHYEKCADEAGVKGLGPYDGNPLKAWHGLFNWMRERNAYLEKVHMEFAAEGLEDKRRISALERRIESAPHEEFCWLGLEIEDARAHNRAIRDISCNCWKSQTERLDVEHAGN